MLSVDKKAAKLCAVILTNLQNFKKAYNWLFIKEENYIIYKADHIYKKLEEKNKNFIKNQI